MLRVFGRSAYYYRLLTSFIQIMNGLNFFPFFSLSVIVKVKLSHFRQSQISFVRFHHFMVGTEREIWFVNGPAPSPGYLNLDLDYGNELVCLL